MKNKNNTSIKKLIKFRKHQRAIETQLLTNRKNIRERFNVLGCIDCKSCTFSCKLKIIRYTVYKKIVIVLVLPITECISYRHISTKHRIMYLRSSPELLKILSSTEVVTNDKICELNAKIY